MAGFDPSGLWARLSADERRGPLFIAYSGGADSLGLLCAASGAGLDVRALHVNHHLTPESDAWAALCTTVCRALGVSLEVIDVTVRTAGDGVEAAARAARYRAIADRLPEGGVVLTAHSLDDQCETLLLRLLRGTGPDGLAGMARRRPLGGGALVRPLLDVSRAELRTWAVGTGHPVVEDPMNADTRLERAWLRRQALPLLSARHPDLPKRLARLARGAAEQREALDWHAGRFMDEDRCLPVAPLAAMPVAVARVTVRGWLRTRGARPPGEARLHQGVADLLGAAHDATPLLRWPGWTVRRHRGRLHLLPDPLPSRPAAPVSGCVGEPIDLGSLGRLDWRRDEGGLPAGLAVELGFREGGECVRIGGHERTVKQLFQQASVPPWERALTPLVRVADGIVAVPGLGIADGAPSGDWHPLWRPPWRGS